MQYYSKSFLLILYNYVDYVLSIIMIFQDKDNTAELNNTEVFVKDPNNVATVLSLLEERDYYVRYSTTQFVTTLLTNKSAGLQDAILLSPMGILRLMDLLGITTLIYCFSYVFSWI